MNNNNPIPISALFSLLGSRRAVDPVVFGNLFGVVPVNDNNSYERLVNLPVVPTPAKNRDILPVMVVQDEVKGENCAICLSEFEIGCQIKTLPCAHKYHVDCIDKWLETQNKCPICKHHVDNS